MTLIVGILCSDGAVVASDGAATLGSLGSPTVRQEVKKLDVLNDKIIVGVSGPVGLGQKIKHKIDAQWSANDFSSLDEVQVSSKISEGMREHINPLLQTAQLSVPVVGNAVAGSSALSSSIVAMIVKHKPTLMQFDFQAASELANNDIPFISVGSGQPLADPFLAFIRRIFWKDHLPNLNEGIFAALWTLSHAIEVNPGGVSKPIQVAVLKEEDGGCAVELEESEYKEHYDAIEAAEEKLSTFREEIISNSIAETVPEPDS
jgi:20S proteasome alpha/beta subunit